MVLSFQLLNALKAFEIKNVCVTILIFRITYFHSKSLLFSPSPFLWCGYWQGLWRSNTESGAKNAMNSRSLPPPPPRLKFSTFSTLFKFSSENVFICSEIHVLDKRGKGLKATILKPFIRPSTKSLQMSRIFHHIIIHIPCSPHRPLL